LLETLEFVLKVGTCHYTGDFSPEKQGFKNGLFSPFSDFFVFTIPSALVYFYA
jgi:hypothetical protein